MCVGISLFCGLLIPLDRLSIILFHAYAFVTTYTQVELCFCMSLFCGLSVPLDSLRVILRYAFSVIIT